MRGGTRTAIALLLMTSMVRSAFAAPDDPPVKDPTAAEALFLAGRDAMKNNDYATACAKFKESDRLDPATGTAANLADCEEKLGEVAAAWASWKEAIELLPANDPRLAPMRERAAAIEKRVPRLTVHAAETLPSDAKMERDDVEMTRASLDTAIPEEPGNHVIIVKAPGHADRSYDVALREGETREIVVDAGAAQATPPPPGATTPPPHAIDLTPAEPSHSGSTRRWIGFGLVGLGVAAVGLGTVTGIVALGKKDDLDGNCFPKNVCNADGASAASEGHTMATISTVSFVVAGAALASGAVLILTAPKSKNPTALVPSAGPHAASLLLESSF